MLLEKFKTAKQPEIQALRQLEYINMLPLPLRIERPSFLDALRARDVEAAQERVRRHLDAVRASLEKSER